MGIKPVGHYLYQAVTFLSTKKSGEISIIETGTIRNPDDEAGDGHSTAFLGRWVSERRKAGIAADAFASIELVHGHVRACREFLGPLAACVDFMLGDSVLILEHFGGPIDFAYLDSCADPVHNLHEFRRVQKWMRAPGIVIIDDTFDLRNASKGLLTMAIAKLQGLPIGKIADRLGVILFGIDPQEFGRAVDDFTTEVNLDWEKVYR